MFPPERIVCLTEETVETLYLLGEQDRIVGISGYCVRPPEARRDKPRVSAFTSANVGKILDLRPDLVLSFSDLQADIVAALIREGIAVHAFNQRTIAEILGMIRLLGALVGAGDRAERLVEDLLAGIAEARQQAKQLRERPRVYFEEWDEPMISGIGWVSELIEIAGGADIFARSGGRQIGEGADRHDRGGYYPPPRNHHRLVVRREAGGDRRRTRLRAAAERRMAAVRLSCLARNGRSPGEESRSGAIAAQAIEAQPSSGQIKPKRGRVARATRTAPAGEDVAEIAYDAQEVRPAGRRERNPGVEKGGNAPGQLGAHRPYFVNRAGDPAQTLEHPMRALPRGRVDVPTDSRSICRDAETERAELLLWARGSR